MRKYPSFTLLITFVISLTAVLFSLFLFSSPVQASSTIYAVLFYSPTCPHCHEVMENVLPPLQEKYGSQLVVAFVNVQEVEGSQLYQSAAETSQTLKDNPYVPALFIGGAVLIGSSDIPAKLPGLIEDGLAKGGVDWPQIPGLQNYLSSHPVLQSTQVDTSLPVVQDSSIDLPLQGTPSTPITSETTTSQPRFITQFQKDPVANSLAVIILIAMLISLIAVLYLFLTANRYLAQKGLGPLWLIPALCLLGIIVAGYLAYIEITGAQAVCGPVGHCNTVQQSPYATLFGFLPVGVFGIIGYIAILIVWLVQYFGASNWRSLAGLAMWGMALLGVLFSIYLTFLEPFVIGATCVWCLGNAIIITVMLWITTGNSLQASEIEEE